MKHWAVEYIGKEWVSGKSGPDTFDCWGLVRYVQKNHFQRIVPEIIIDADNVKDVVKTFATHEELNNWREVDHPKDGDCILMSQNTRPNHVGVWIQVDRDGGVLHACKGIGVVFTPIRYLENLGYNLLGFYTC